MADVSGFESVAAFRQLAKSTCYRYHDLTKHTVDKLLSGDHYLDWKNQPDPFRSYKGADVIELARSVCNDESVRYFDLVPAGARMAVHEHHADLELISNLLFYSTAISAWKQVRNSDNRWALRVNASSGNLHPTETHLAIDRIAGVDSGIYHYKVDDHGLEFRARGDQAKRLWSLAGNEADRCPPMIVCFTSILWRECWKYRQRGFRYCQHDMGHALGALMVAANSLGWTVKPYAIFADAEVAHELELTGTDETPALIVGLRPGAAVRDGQRIDHPGRRERFGTNHGIDTSGDTSTDDGSDTVNGVRTESSVDTGSDTSTTASIDTASSTDSESSAGSAKEHRGTPNVLSTKVIEYEIVDLVQSACLMAESQVAGVREKLRANLHSRSLFVDARPTTLEACDQDISARLDISYARQVGAHESAHRTIRRRRSAVDMDGRKRMSLADLTCILSTSTRGFDADFSQSLSLAPAQTNQDCGAYLVDLFVYVHRVDDLQAGLYFFDRPRQELVPLALADQRQNAKFVSCFQDIAADGCFAISMVADLARAYYLFGDRGYKLVHYEAGVIGQLLYLGATALGYDSTGIGCFIDDAINQYLVLPEGTEVIYNFTIGGAVVDPRLTTLPAYDFAQ
jgi:SagB-type dehydrogenase family enzyme